MRTPEAIHERTCQEKGQLRVQEARRDAAADALQFLDCGRQAREEFAGPRRDATVGGKNQRMKGAVFEISNPGVVFSSFLALMSAVYLKGGLIGIGGGQVVPHPHIKKCTLMAPPKAHN